MDVTFVQTFADKVLEDFWLGFEIFEQTGPMQTVHGIFEQDGQIEDVSFSVQEPEYLYDTGFADDPFVQEEDKKKQKGGDATPPADEVPLRPAAVLASASPYAAPAATQPAANAAGTSAATMAPTGGNPAVKLATPIDSNAPAAAPSNERWWTIRAVVVMIMLVIGRKMQLSARARLVSTRRRPRPK